MDETTEPALTPEEWAETQPVVGEYDDDIYSLASPGLTPQRLHALAARALHGQPFGFTWDDVRVLEDASSALISTSKSAQFAHDADEAARLWPLIDALCERIIDLLPPRR